MYSKIFVLAMACMAMVPIADSITVVPCTSPCNSLTAVTFAVSGTLNNCLVAIYGTGVALMVILWLIILIQTLVVYLTGTFWLACLDALTVGGAAASTIAAIILLLLQCIVELIIIIILWLKGTIVLIVCQTQIAAWYAKWLLKFANYVTSNVKVKIVLVLCINVVQMCKTACDTNVI